MKERLRIAVEAGAAAVEVANSLLPKKRTTQTEQLSKRLRDAGQKLWDVGPKRRGRPRLLSGLQMYHLREHHAEYKKWRRLHEATSLLNRLEDGKKLCEATGLRPTNIDAFEAFWESVARIKGTSVLEARKLAVKDARRVSDARRALRKKGE